MVEKVPPPGSGQVQQQGNQNQDNQPADIYFFPSMPFTKEEYHKFLDNEFKFLGSMIRHDMQRMKKALQKMKRMETGQD